MGDIGVRIRVAADTSEASAKIGALANSLAASRQTSTDVDVGDSQSSLRNQFLRDSSLGGYAQMNEINQKFGALLNSIASSGNAFNSSLKSGDLGASKDYADLQLNLRNQFLKDTNTAGYNDVKLDSKPLETAIYNLTVIMNQMIADGKSKEAKEYGDVLKRFQGQLSSESSTKDEQKTKIAQDQQTRFIRGMTRFFGIGQNAIGQAGSGNAAGAALGAAGGATDILGMIKSLPAPVLAGAGIAAAVVALGATANKLSEQWEKVMQPSMGLAASLGELGANARQNSAAFKEVFNRATSANVLHGYKMEEGLQLANDLSKAGVGSRNVYNAASNVFGYQRATDADRGVLSRAVGFSERYRGGENVLGYAYGGMKASGMEHGQYQEYLNATLRIFEEGLSKGVVKGFAEITRTQNMLAQIGDSWKGEAGMERRQNINSAIEGSYHLQNDYDVIMYRAAQAMAGEGAEYGDIAKLLDKGIDAADSSGRSVLGYIGDVIRENIGEGNAAIMTTMKAFNLTYTAAEEFFDAISGDNLNFARAKEILEDPTSKDVQSSEEKLLSASEQIRVAITNIGSELTATKADMVSGFSRIINYMAGNRSFTTASHTTMDAILNTGISPERADRIQTAFNKAYTATNQPDADGSGLGDYGERAMRIQERMAALSEDDRFWLAANPNNDVFSYLENTFRRAEDFTEENTRVALARMNPSTLTVARRGRSGSSQRREQFGSIADSIEGDSTSANILRTLMTTEGMYDAIPTEALQEIAKYQHGRSMGGSRILSDDTLGPSETDMIVRALNEFARSIPELAAALRDASTIVIREEGGR